MKQGFDKSIKEDKEEGTLIIVTRFLTLIT